MGYIIILSLSMVFLAIYIAYCKPLLRDSVAYSNYISKNKGFIIFAVLMGTLFLLSALRGSSVGKDTSNYLYYAKSIVDRGNVLFSHRLEPGFQYFMLLSGKLLKQNNAILISSSFVCYLLLFVYYRKYTNNATICLALFYPLYFASFMNIIRQSIAACILLFAYERLKQKKLVRSILLIALATSFHYVSIVFFSLVFLKNRKIDKKVIGIIVFLFGLSISGLIVPIFNIILSNYYAGYMSSDRVGSGYLGCLANLTIVATLFYFYNKNVKDENRSLLNNWCFVFCFVFYIFAFAMNLFDRVGLLYLFVLVPVIADSLVESKCNKNRFHIVFVVLILIGWFLLSNTLRPEWEGIYPYSSFYS